MYLKEIHLENIKTFKDLRFDFTINGKPRLCTGFLGPNGMGKSVLLDCITASLAGESAMKSALPYPRDWVRSGEDYGLIEAKIDVSDEEEADIPSELLLRYFVTGKKGADINGRFFQGYGIYGDYNNEGNKFFDKVAGYDSKGFLICGYGPFRRPPRGEGKFKVQSKSETNPRSSRITTLFDEGSPVSEVESWLINLEYRSLKEGKEKKDVFNAALNLLHNILPNVTFKEINSDGQVIFNTEDGLESPLSELSDGYRSVIAWSANLVQHMFDAHVHLPDKTQGTGVVVIDEIDVHLHPGAQRKVITHLRELFPNIQFILSSHSPFVAQSLKQNEIFRLDRDKEQKQTVIRSVEVSFEGWRVDQILTTDAFGLETTRDIKTENELIEYEKLIKKIELNRDVSTDDKQRASALKEKIFSKIPFSGENQRIRELEKQVSGLLAALEKNKK